MINSASFISRFNCRTSVASCAGGVATTFAAKWLVKTGFALILTLVWPAMSQTQTLNDVVVTGWRAAQRSFDMPGAVASVDRDTIQGAGPQVNLSESLNRVPGLTIINRQNYAQDLQVSIRGFGARSAFGIRGIRLMVDGIPATTPDGQGQGSSISLTSTDRIEVLSGPLAQLYGNSSGGVIQAHTRDAPAMPEVKAQYYLGSYGMHRADVQYAGRIGGIGLVADSSTFDTLGLRDNSRSERRQLNGKLSFDHGEVSRVNLVFNQFNMPLAQDPLGLTLAQLNANRTQAGTTAVSRRARKTVLQNQLGSSLTHSIDADSAVAGRLYYGTRDNLQYQTGLATSTGAWVGLARTYCGAGLQYNTRTWLGDRAVNLSVAYEFDRSSERRQGGAAALGEKATTTRNEDDQAKNSGLVIQATSPLSDELSLVAGLRYSIVRLVSNDRFPDDGNGSGAKSFRAASPVVGLTWHASNVLNAYANVGKGFESPTLAEVAYNGAGAPAFNTALNASGSQHYEIGTKWIPNARSHVAFAVFRVDSTDEIVVSSSTGGNATFKNAPGTRRIGHELSASGLITPHWRAALASSSVDASFSQTFTSGTTVVLAKNKMPGVLTNFIFSTLTWTARDLTRDRIGNGAKDAKPDVSSGAEASLELTKSGSLFVNDINSAAVHAYTKLNVNASYAWALGNSRLTSYARIDNLTDERYVASVIVNQASSQFYEPAPGRNWTLGFRLAVSL